ncbi:DnaJ domain-containing protein, partial [Baffinella frigidus]
LGISKEASPGEIKKAFRKLAVQHHPDKGGDEDEFKAISMAYEILSDEQKRKIYDEGGLEALEGGGGGGGGEAGDIFSAFFGGRGGRGRRSGPRKGEDLVHPISMTLEHLYNGKTSKLALSRNVICETCKGSGSKTPGANTTCGGCQGQGIKLVSRQIAPGMIQQMQTPCTLHPTPDSPHPTPDNPHPPPSTLTPTPYTLNATPLPGEADQQPGTEPGDVVFVIQQTEHARFIRKGDDLLLQLKITLSEALCGATIAIDHLDARQII